MLFFCSVPSLKKCLPGVLRAPWRVLDLNKITEHVFYQLGSAGLLRTTFAFCFFLSVPFGFSVHAGLFTTSETRKLMGTLVRITVVSGNARGSDRAIKAAFSVMAKIDALMSTYKQSSEISRLNRSGKKTFRVDPMTFEVIQRGLYWGRASGGVFDITVGKMKKLYNLDTKGDVPERGAIKRGMQSVGYDFIQLATPDQVTLPVAGMSIDLGGIAKGYAVEQALLSIQKEGVFSAMVNAGGDIGTIGTKMGEDWKVGILHPRKQEELLGVLGVQNCFVATSGDYMQFTEKEGRRYSHIIDPRSGSASPGKMSVTVIAGSGADADALATTLFVMKKDEGLKLVEKIANVEAMLVTKNGEIFYSSGFKGFLVQK